MCNIGRFYIILSICCWGPKFYNNAFTAWGVTGTSMGKNHARSRTKFHNVYIRGRCM